MMANSKITILRFVREILVQFISTSYNRKLQQSDTIKIDNFFKVSTTNGLPSNGITRNYSLVQYLGFEFNIRPSWVKSTNGCDIPTPAEVTETIAVFPLTDLFANTAPRLVSTVARRTVSAARVFFLLFVLLRETHLKKYIKVLFFSLFTATFLMC